jgi:hypothetical protein
MVQGEPPSANVDTGHVKQTNVEHGTNSRSILYGIYAYYRATIFYSYGPSFVLYFLMVLLHYDELAAGSPWFNDVAGITNLRDMIHVVVFTHDCLHFS